MLPIQTSRAMTDIAIQRRYDALDILELPGVTAEETEKIELGLLKQNMMWWFNKAGYLAYGLIIYKGRLLERNKLHGLSLMRCFIVFLIGKYYLQFGDYLGGCCLYGDIKYIFLKYEPVIRERRMQRSAAFVNLESFKNRYRRTMPQIDAKKLYDIKD